MNKIKAGIVGLVVASFAFAFNAQADSSYTFGNVGGGYDFHGWNENGGLMAGFQAASGTEGTTTMNSGGVMGGTHLNYGAASADGAVGGNAYASNDGHTAVATSGSVVGVNTSIYGSGDTSISGVGNSTAVAVLPHHHWF